MKKKKISISILILLTILTHAQSEKTEISTELQDATTKVDGHRLHYLTGGSGPILLMLHGMTLNCEQWIPFAKDFMDSYTVVIVDLPGHGGSSPFHDTFSFSKSAKLMLGLLDELGAKQVYGIGHSAGGITLLHMATQQPKRMKSMVLVDAPHYLGPEARKLVRDDTWERLDPEVQEWYRKLHPGGQAQAVNIFRQYNALADCSEHIMAEMLKSLPTNTLIIWGDSDPAFPLEIPMEMYRSLSNAALWIIPLQGHAPLWTDMGGDASAAASFVNIAEEFLSREKISREKWF